MAALACDIFDFSAETTEQNSMKLKRKQKLNVLYQVCVFGPIGKKQDDRPSLWLAETFSTSPQKPLTEFNETWQEARSQRPLPSFKLRAVLNIVPYEARNGDFSHCFGAWLNWCFSNRSEKQDGRPCLWFAATFSTSPLQLLNRIQRNLTGSKISMFSTKFVFFGPIGKTRWLPQPLIGWDLFRLLLWNRWSEFKETWKEARSNIIHQVCVFQVDLKKKNQDGRPCLWLAEIFSTSPLNARNGIERKLTGNNISAFSTRFVFFWPIEKARWPSWPMIGWYILDFFSETVERNSTKLDRKQDFKVLSCTLCCLLGLLLYLSLHF